MGSNDQFKEVLQAIVKRYDEETDLSVPGCLSKWGEIMAHDPAKFWHTKDELEARKDIAYSDWEGMADAEEVISWCKHFKETWGLNDFQADVLLHLAYEQRDQTGHLPDSGEMHGMCYAITELTTVHQWMKSDVNWVTEKINEG